MSKFNTVVLPFSGFYESIHNSLLDDELNMHMFTDYATGCTNNEGLSQLAYDGCNWSDVFNGYAEEYTKNLAHEFKIKMTFESLQSPKEYNFTTDRIFANISYEELKRIYDACNKTNFNKLAVDTFTSRDGFNSFYNPAIETWGPLNTWDHNQLACLLESFINEGLTGESLDEYSIMESSISNGFLYDLLSENIKNIDRLHKIHEYLNAREARKETLKLAA